MSCGVDDRADIDGRGDPRFSGGSGRAEVRRVVVGARRARRVCCEEAIVDPLTAGPAGAVAAGVHGEEGGVDPVEVGLESVERAGSGLRRLIGRWCLRWVVGAIATRSTMRPVVGRLGGDALGKERRPVDDQL